MGENQQNRFLFYEMTSVDIIVSNVPFTISSSLLSKKR